MYREEQPDGLSDRDRERAEERTRPNVRVIHEAIRREGAEEITRASTGLAWSGFAAGLSMGFSLVAQGLLRGYLPDAGWSPLIWRLGYPLGFVIVVLGRQELFTETTLTAVVPMFSRHNIETLRDMLRVWGIVLVANLAGAVLFAVVLADLHVFDTPTLEQFAYIGTHAADGSWGSIVIRGIFAGWLIALVVWLLPLAGGNRLWMIVILTYFVGLGSFSHIIAGSVEVMFAAIYGGVSWQHYLGGYLVPTLLGNTIGGASLLASLNTAQVEHGDHS